MKSIIGMIALLAIAMAPGNLEARVLHAVLMQGEGDGSFQIDLDNMEAVLRNGLPQNQLRIHRLPIETTGQQALESVRGLRIAEDDSVLVFYSGHGSFDRNQGHALAFSERDLVSRRDMENAITQPFRPRFWALITDCCAKFTRLFRQGVPQFLPSNLLRHLFLETEGRVDINACCPGQVALGGPNGGLFTQSLIEVFNEQRDRRLDWDDVFRMVRSKTAQRYEGIPPHEMGGPQKVQQFVQRTQIPYSFKTMYGQDVNAGRFGAYIKNGLIDEIEAGLPAEQHGFRVGMRVVSVNGYTLATDGDCQLAFESSPRQATIVVSDGGERRAIQVELAY